MSKQQKQLDKLFDLAEKVFDIIVQKCAVEGQVNFDELDIVVDRIKLLKDRLITFETAQSFTIAEIEKALKKLKRMSVSQESEYIG